MKKKLETYRQGDVLLVRHDPAGCSFKRAGSAFSEIVLARGELTGHVHAFDGEGAHRVGYSFHDEHHDTSRDGLPAVIQVPDGGATLKHGTPERGYVDGDHADLRVPPGTYKVIRQREASVGLVSGSD